MTFDYKIIPYQKELVDSTSRIDGFPEKRRSVTRRFRKDRRRKKLDRRKSIRDGVIVNLSFKEDRRTGRDRRNVTSSGYKG